MLFLFCITTLALASWLGPVNTRLTPPGPGQQNPPATSHQLQFVKQWQIQIPRGDKVTYESGSHRPCLGTQLIDLENGHLSGSARPQMPFLMAHAADFSKVNTMVNNLPFAEIWKGKSWALVQEDFTSRPAVASYIHLISINSSDVSVRGDAKFSLARPNSFTTFSGDPASGCMVVSTFLQSSDGKAAWLVLTPSLKISPIVLVSVSDSRYPKKILGCPAPEGKSYNWSLSGAHGGPLTCFNGYSGKRLWTRQGFFWGLWVGRFVLAESEVGRNWCLLDGATGKVVAHPDLPTGVPLFEVVSYKNYLLLARASKNDKGPADTLGCFKLEP